MAVGGPVPGSRGKGVSPSLLKPNASAFLFQPQIKVPRTGSEKVYSLHAGRGVTIEMTSDWRPSDVSHVEKIAAVSQPRGNTGGAFTRPHRKLPCLGRGKNWREERHSRWPSQPKLLSLYCGLYMLDLELFLHKWHAFCKLGRLQLSLWRRLM